VTDPATDQAVGPASRRTLSSVHNAARLLKAFRSNERDLGVTELANRLGLGKSTVHRLLATLIEEQLIEQDEQTGRYRLGLAVFELGAAASSPSGLHQSVVAPMSMLRLRTGETVQTAVLDGRQVVYVERLESPNTLRLFLEVGQRNDAHCTSTGKVLLAGLSPERLDEVLDGWVLPAHTLHTITDPVRLRAELRTVRSQGYAVNSHESEVSVLSIGAPIRDRTGKVVAAMSVAGPAERLEPEQQKVVQAVVEAAASASRRLR
jgi:IclR family transcriptional regulator, KDG regulon repressor